VSGIWALYGTSCPNYGGPPVVELANSLLGGVADSVREAVDILTRFLQPELSFSLKVKKPVVYS